tara:strand:- start:341 stop:592 length:252 start_codon:yes stop_codon:yes gene_type:complete
MDYTITLTDTEQKCLEYIAVDVDDWITNAAQNRARQAKEQILAVNSAHCNANGIAIAVGEDAQVTQAYSLGLVAKATSEYKTE